MSIHPSVKILVLLFSLALASLMTWQLRKNIQGSAQEQAPEKEQTQEDPSDNDDPQAIHVGPKSAGAIDLKELFPSKPVNTNSDKKEEDEEKPKQRPLLPSSKSIVAPVFEE